MRSAAARVDSRRLLSHVKRLLSGSAGIGRQGGGAPLPVPVRRDERGQTLIEFAFVAPIILIFLLLIVDFGLALDSRQMLQNAVREGARYGAVGNDPASVITFTENSGVPGTTIVTVCYLDEDGNGNAGDAGDSVRVKARHDYELTVNVFAGSLTSIQMEPYAQARLEKAVTGVLNGC